MSLCICAAFIGEQKFIYKGEWVVFANVI